MGTPVETRWTALSMFTRHLEASSTIHSTYPYYKDLQDKYEEGIPR